MKPTPLCRIALALAGTAQLGVAVTLISRVKVTPASQHLWLQIWLGFVFAGVSTLTSQFVRGLFIPTVVANLVVVSQASRSDPPGP